MEGQDWTWIPQLIGRLHPLIVHFPIGLLVTALILELLTLTGKRNGLREGITWMVYLGSVGAVVAALCGWLLITFEDYGDPLVQSHQNFGLATTLLSITSALLLNRAIHNKSSNYLPYRITLLLTVISLFITGHQGASLTHGSGYLSDVMPSANKNVVHGSYDKLALWQGLDSLTESQHDELNLAVRGIFAHNCHQCHSENKKKGDLALDNKRGVFNGGESGAIISPGNSASSELYRRISLPGSHKEVMPKKGKTLRENEIAIVKLWIDQGARWSDRALQTFPEAPLTLTKPPLPKDNAESHPIDQWVDVYFDHHSIGWPDVVDDRTFIRRAYLDIVGLLPKPNDIDRFVSQSGQDKRRELIEQLLSDSQNYAQHWLSFWNDLLRNDYSGTGFITGGRKQITDWIYQSLLENKPYDLMVKELVNPIPESEGFIKGIQWRGVVNSSQRTEMQAAQNIGQSLMGMNVKCASCHNSFVSNLTLDQAYGFASVFAKAPLQLNRCDVPTGKVAKVSFLYPELGSVEADSLDERLAKLAEVMVKPENGRLYRTIVNRFWKRLLGRGIVEPVDEMDNPSWNSDLLDWLASDFIDSDHDLKDLIKTIMTSKTYQLATSKYESIDQVRSKEFVFEGPVIRRLSTEQFADAISQIISPVYYAAAFHPSDDEISSNRIWHPEIKFDRHVLPEPGTRYFRHRFTLDDQEIRTANMLVSVDHSFKLYINGGKIAQGTDWRKVTKIDVVSYLKPGENIIAIEGYNDGNIANPAGILFSMKMIQANEKVTLITSERGSEWRSTDKRPGEDWVTVDYDDSSWLDVRNFGSSYWDHLVSFNYNEDADVYARASLVRQDPFMKIMGRPTRENVATTRDDQANLLQALELTNGSFLNGILEEGAKIWLKEYASDKEQLVESLFHQALGRRPMPEEKKLMVRSLGDKPTKESVQDIFWATLLLPEFQFIH